MEESKLAQRVGSGRAWEEFCEVCLAMLPYGESEHHGARAEDIDHEHRKQAVDHLRGDVHEEAHETERPDPAGTAPRRPIIPVLAASWRRTTGTRWGERPV